MLFDAAIIPFYSVFNLVPKVDAASILVDETRNNENIENRLSRRIGLVSDRKNSIDLSQFKRTIKNTDV